MNVPNRKQGSAKVVLQNWIITIMFSPSSNYFPPDVLVTRSREEKSALNQLCYSLPYSTQAEQEKMTYMLAVKCTRVDESFDDEHAKDNVTFKSWTARVPLGMQVDVATTR